MKTNYELQEIKNTLEKLHKKHVGKTVIFLIMGISIAVLTVMLVLYKMKNKLVFGNEDDYEEFEDDYDDDEDDDEIREDYYALDYEDIDNDDIDNDEE